MEGRRKGGDACLFLLELWVLASCASINRLFCFHRSSFDTEDDSFSSSPPPQPPLSAAPQSQPPAPQSQPHTSQTQPPPAPSKPAPRRATVAPSPQTTAADPFPPHPRQPLEPLIWRLSVGGAPPGGGAGEEGGRLTRVDERGEEGDMGRGVSRERRREGGEEPPPQSGGRGCECL